MGTRATIHIKDGKSTLVSIYRQMDGYPTGLGKEIKKLLMFSELVDGFSAGDVSPAKFNGMGCLAAYLVGSLKLIPNGRISNPIGNVYITNKADRQEYNYFIYAKGNEIYMDVTDADDKKIYSGTMLKFDAEKVQGE